MSYNPRIYIKDYGASTERLFAGTAQVEVDGQSVRLLRALKLNAARNDFPELLLLSGDMQGGADRVILSGDMQTTGSDAILFDGNSVVRAVGQVARLRRSLRLHGAYFDVGVSPQQAQMLVGRVIRGGAASVAASGQPSSIKRALVLHGNAASVTVSGQTATLSSVEALLLSGDMQSGADRLLLSGDMQSGADILLLSQGT